MRPNADNVDGTWTNESNSNVNLFASIDEITASDSDFIKSKLDPVADVVKLKLDTPISTNPPVTIFYRYWKTGAGAMNLVVRLKQGNTTIASNTHNGISKDHTDGSFSLSTPEFNNITNFSDLYIEFQAN